MRLSRENVAKAPSIGHSTEQRCNSVDSLSSFPGDRGQRRVKEGKSASQRKSELERTRMLQIHSFNKYLNAHCGPAGKGPYPSELNFLGAM